MDWAEAWRLTTVLAGDPSSQVCAALAGWQYPMGREGIALLALYDLTLRANAAKPKSVKPWPRPWDPAPKIHGSNAVSIEQWKRMKEARTNG